MSAELKWALIGTALYVLIGLVAGEIQARAARRYPPSPSTPNTED